MNIAIAGYGIEGKASARYYKQRSYDITILDERPEVDDLPDDVSVRLGQDAFTNLDAYDMVIRTPSLPPKKLAGARKVWSATNEFFAHCPAPIIGVTGTKGKGTTASLIASILKAAGKTVHLVGNIGQSGLDVLDHIRPDDIVVYELSSFQLWDAEYSPHIAVVLMIEADHLDVHSSFEEYIAAKSNIIRYQDGSDMVVYTDDNPNARGIALLSRAVKTPVPLAQGVRIQDGAFWYGNQKLCSVDTVRLPGAHNKHNAAMAIAAAWPYVKEPLAVAAGLAAFKGLPHRLAFVRDVDGVRYYDDSIATTVGSAIAAMRAFNQPKIIILGGSSKGVVDFNQVANEARTANVTQAILIGDQAPVIEETMRRAGVPYSNLGSAVSMSGIVHEAHKNARPGDVVILSPACASFGMFNGYADRGNQFIAAVNAL